MEFDLAFVVPTRPTGWEASLAPRVAVSLGLPYLSYASEIEPADDGVRIQRLSATGYDVLTAPTPAVVMGTQVLGEPRYPAFAGSCRRAPSRSTVDRC